MKLGFIRRTDDIFDYGRGRRLAGSKEHTPRNEGYCFTITPKENETEESIFVRILSTVSDDITWKKGDQSSERKEFFFIDVDSSNENRESIMRVFVTIRNPRWGKEATIIISRIF